MRISLLLLAGTTAFAQQPYTAWRDYLGSPDSAHYSALAQINRSNVTKLQEAWRFETGDNVAYGTNPTIIDDVAYVIARDYSVVAVNAATGKEIWTYKTGGLGERHRGVNYWESKDRSDRRILLPTNNFLQAIDARTGKLIPSFGSNGSVDLKEGLGRDLRSVFRIQSGSPGRIYDNLLILGSTTGEDYMSPPGDIRAYDVRSGKMAWIFHTVPHPGEFGYDSWPKDAWKYIGGTNTWGELTLDEKRGIVYLPIGSPTYDFYGADRKGDNLFSDCIVALDAKTGKRLWHFQFVHHDLWDYDAVAAPTLLTVKHDGKMVDVVAQASKQGFLYVFDRVTGKPLWPIEERPVPKSDMPGEFASATQPFPTKPPAFARQKFTADDVNPLVLDQADRSNWKDTIASARNEGIFTPPGFRNTVSMPGNHGGANWGAGAADPNAGLMYVVSMDVPAILKLGDVPNRPPAVPSGTAAEQGLVLYKQNCQMCHGPNREGSPPSVPALVKMPQKLGSGAFRKIVQGGIGDMPGFSGMSEQNLTTLEAFLNDQTGGPELPSVPSVRPSALPYPPGVQAPEHRYWTDYGLKATIIRPPWSTLTAYDLNEGVIRWQVPLGDAPETFVPNLGVFTIRDGAAVTAGGLIFIATKNDGRLRALDRDNGLELWNTELPAGSEGIPAVYEVNGREYVLVCATTPKGSLLARGQQKPITRSYVAYALPPR